MTTSQLLGTAEAAARLGVARTYIPRLVEKGDLTPAGTIGKRGIFVFEIGEIDRCKEQRAGKVGA